MLHTITNYPPNPQTYPSRHPFLVRFFVPLIDISFPQAVRFPESANLVGLRGEYHWKKLVHTVDDETGMTRTRSQKELGVLEDSDNEQ